LKNVVLGDVTPSNVKEILPTFQRKFGKFLPEWTECVQKGRIIQGHHRESLDVSKGPFYISLPLTVPIIDTLNQCKSKWNLSWQNVDILHDTSLL